MEKQILIPVSENRKSLRAVRYAAHAASFINDLRFVLFHVQPMISLYLQDEAKTDLHVRAELNKMKAKNETAAMEILENYKAEMISLGVEASRIEMETHVRKLGLAQDVIEYAQEKLFDAILIGRQPVSGIQKFFGSSVSSAILERSQVLPVWMVDGNPGGRRLLVAVDGSEASMRAVDHVGFMVSRHLEASLTLLHVTNTAQNYCEIDLDVLPEAAEFVDIVDKGERACIDQFYPQAMKQLEGMGLSGDQIRFEQIKGGRRIGKTVVDYAEKNAYDTIVFGRTGIDRSFFMGSVSRQIISSVTESALWVVN